MSYQDQTQTQSAPFPGDPAAFWQSSWTATDHHHHQSPPETTASLDHRFKRPRTAYDKPSNFPPPQHPRINPPPPIGGRGTSHIFFKTRMCAKFVEGTCRNGDLCTFAHGLNDLRDPPPNWQEILREKERNSGTGNHWSSVGGEDDRKPLHRFKICMKYYNGEECPYGERCNFVHERGPSQLAAVGRFVEADVLQRESLAIGVGAEGRVSGGSGELEQRALWRTRVCSKWEIGHCPYGDRCHYAHGQSELRSFSNGDEPPDQVWINACNNNSMSRNLSSVAGPPVNLATPDCKNKNSKWKLTKKINRIYADWLDDADLPHYSGNQDY